MLEFEHGLDDLREQIRKLELNAIKNPGSSTTHELTVLRLELEARTADVFANLTPWQRVQLARHPQRPHTLDFVERLFPNFTELHGDRRYGDDAAIVAGLAEFEGISVVVIGHQKGRTTSENVRRNFGMAHPEGYRKARRLFDMAEKFGLPLFTFLDTPGASPNLEDEERGQSWSISENMARLSQLRVPIIVTVIGEGGSGGALGIGIGNRILMLEHSYYSVISPEGCAAILWKSAEHKEQAANILKLTAEDLDSFGIIDEIIPEPLGGAHRDPPLIFDRLKESILRHIGELSKLSGEELIRDRYDKFCKMGEFEERLKESVSN